MEWQAGYADSFGYAFFAEVNHQQTDGWKGLVGIRLYLDKGKSLKSRHRTGDPESDLGGFGICPAGQFLALSGSCISDSGNSIGDGSGWGLP